jgi:hypothetical protein
MDRKQLIADLQTGPVRPFASLDFGDKHTLRRRGCQRKAERTVPDIRQQCNLVQTAILFAMPVRRSTLHKTGKWWT